MGEEIGSRIVSGLRSDARYLRDLAHKVAETRGDVSEFGNLHRSANDMVLRAIAWRNFQRQQHMLAIAKEV